MRFPRRDSVYIKKDIASILLLLALLLFLYQAFQNPAGDVSFFMQAGGNLRLGKNPYFLNGEYTGFYNGPIFAIILIPFSFLSSAHGLLVWRCLNLFITGVLLNELRKREPQLFQISLFSFLILGFPWRDNFSNDSLVLIQLFLVLLVIRATEANRNWAASLFLFLALELKPYLLIPIMLVLLCRRQWSIISALAFITLLANTTYHFIFHVTYLDWLETLLGRNGAWTAADQSTIRTSLWKYFQLPGLFATVIGVLLYLATALLAMKYFRGVKGHLDRGTSWMMSFVFAPLFPVYSHEQDYLFSLFALAWLLTRISRLETNLIFILPFMFILNWSSDALMLGLGINILGWFLISEYFYNFNKFNLFLFSLLSSLIIVLQNIIRTRFGITNQFYFHNFQAMIFGLSLIPVFFSFRLGNTQDLLADSDSSSSSRLI